MAEISQFSVEQYRQAARRAVQAGDMATARSLIARGMSLQASEKPADPLAGLNARAREIVNANPVPERDPLANARDVGENWSDRRRQREFDATREFLALPLEEQRRINRSERILSEASAPENFLAAASQGVPLIGEWVDEGLNAVAPGAGDGLRERRTAIEDVRPVSGLAANLVGSVAGSLPALLAAPALPIPASMAGKIATTAVTGATLGGVEGAAAGAGRNPEDRVGGAMRGGKVGAILGGIAGGAAPAASFGIRKSLEYLRNSDVATIARQFGLSRDAAFIVKRSLMNDDLDAAEAAVRRAGGDAMLADAGTGTRQLLDDAMSAGGAATRIGRDAVEARAATAASGVNRALDNVLGPPEGFRAAARNISQRTAQIRGRAYDRAYGSAVDYSGEQGRRIEEVLSRVPPNTLKAAVDEANEAMLAAGNRNLQIMAEIGDDGSVVFREMPNVQQLDEIKKALGGIAAAEVDQFGRRTARGIRYGRLSGELRDAIGDAVPAYRTAVRLGGDKIAEDSALDLGRRAFSSERGIREEVRDFVAGSPSRAALDAFKSGLRGYIDDAMARVQRTMTDPNVPAREALMPIKALSSRQNRETIAAVLGEEQAKRLFSIVERETMKLELRAAVARNSQTAIRTAGREAMEAVTEPGIAGSAARGAPVNAMRRIMQALTGTTPADDLARRQDIYKEIATALTRIRGPEAEQAIGLVRKAMNGQPLAEAEARMVANLVAGSIALGGYQTGYRLLAR